MWELLEIEKWLSEGLVKQLGSSNGQALFGAYTLARNYLITQVLEEIKVNEPDLSDHGPRHIHEVLQNAQTLIWPSLADPDSFSKPHGGLLNKILPHEVFLLALSCIFHDVGNVFKRNGHNRKIIPVLNSAYPTSSPYYLQVRSLVQQIAAAHTGLSHGSSDTLQNLTTGSMSGIPVRVRDLAAVLRLADELAEGPHRSSDWRYHNIGYAPNSKIYHLYAKVCQRPAIDMALGRVALTYILDMNLNSDKESLQLEDMDVADLLSFIYKRITKLDQERKYNKHYSSFLHGLRETSAAFEFYIDGNQIQPEISPIILSDVVIPGDASKSITDVDARYEVVKLHGALLNLVQGR